VKTTVRTPNDHHRQFRDELTAVLRKHASRLSAMEMLALAAHLVGQLIAMQDQRSLTPAMALKLVSDNIEQGNREAIGLNPEGRA